MRTLPFLIMTVFLSACNKTNIEPPSHHLAVNFSADINQSQVTPITRATATAFVAADAIGVFMKTAGSALTASNLDNNVQYTTSNGSNFTATAPIYYPQIGNVDFIAYYPYTASLLTANSYRVNVATQSTPSAIDLLWSNNATTKNE